MTSLISRVMTAALWTGSFALAAPGEPARLAEEPRPEQAQVRLGEGSEPVTENGADFQVVAPARWLVPAPGGKSAVEIGLKITNHTEKMMQINVHDTLKITLKDANGRELRCGVERDASFIPEPVVIEKGQSATIARKASLELTDGGNALRLSGPDGSGGVWHFDHLVPGKYTLSISYTNDEGRMRSVLRRAAKHVPDPKEAPFWMGKVTTKELSVEIADAPAKP